MEGKEQERRHSPLSLLCAWGGFLSGVVTAAAITLGSQGSASSLLKRGISIHH